MMHSPKDLIESFYSAFQKLDYQTMQRAYHPEARFYDPVFQHLNATEVKAMWEMLLTSATDLRISFHTVETNNQTGTCQWEAWYTFSKTGRTVHNRITATFEFKDGKIMKHHDHFHLWRWSRQALGATGWLLGWSSAVQGKVRSMAKQNLKRFMERQLK